MKLLSCYIAGFGKFVNRSFDLSNDVIVVKEDNGWGKTTLADFLKCMFYGMDGGRTKSIETNERAKYEPWQSQAFGGTLTFTAYGKTYRIERVFGKTPAADIVKVYDQNNMLCYDFGDKAERIGEVLFGMDGESFRRCVYIPQGEIKTDGLPSDMKNRLLALLSSGGADENGAARAIERLETAERALRAKRRPSKGKLDELDDKLLEISRQKAECAKFAEAKKQAEYELQKRTTELSECNEKIKALSSVIEKIAKNNEWAAKRGVYNEVQEQAVRNRVALDEFGRFFGEIDPKTVNIKGLQTAVSEFYALKEENAKVEVKLREIETKIKERDGSSAQLVACKKTMSSYGKILNKNDKTEGAGTPTNEKPTKKEGGKKRGSFLWLFVGLFAIIYGATQAESNPTIGYFLLGLGALGLLWTFIQVLPKYVNGARKNRKKTNNTADELDDTFAIEYTQTEAEIAFLQKRLKQFPPDLDTIKEQYGAILEEKTRRAEGLEKAIVEFLKNFGFSGQYDYRASLSVLQEKIVLYSRVMQENADNQQRLKTLETELQTLLDGEETAQYPTGNLDALRTEKSQWERRKETLYSEWARLSALVENYALKCDINEFNVEEKRLSEEKQRLERRLFVVQSAKKFLLRAQENMATRYLSPVEKNCKKHLESMGVSASGLHFTADGAAQIETQGKTHGVEYYSTGERELTDFCTRIALIETLFTKEQPPLVLDDPFANLDDKKTERAKKFVKDLSKRYQILYFTCKSDRKL
ncbi:MAG: AAA family ATPase [Clostridia bacterium]|nr:AAA family ATPase [Clostridia bacterium]